MNHPSASLKLRLIARAEAGVDDWGQPVLEETVLPAAGYFWQFGVDDSDRAGGNVERETGKVLLWPDDAFRFPRSWHAIEFDVLGETQRWEIIGPPEPKHSIALGGQLHHWEMLVSRAAA